MMIGFLVVFFLGDKNVVVFLYVFIIFIKMKKKLYEIMDILFKYKWKLINICNIKEV